MTESIDPTPAPPAHPFELRNGVREIVRVELDGRIVFAANVTIDELKNAIALMLKQKFPRAHQNERYT